MSDYPVLDNRPINKWKVAELREELNRRNLMTKGLKDELVRRLNEDICKEMEAAEVEESKDDERDIDPASGLEDTEPEPDPVKLVNDVLEHPQSEVTKGSDLNTDSACGLEDAQPNSNPAKLVDNVQKHRQNEVNDIGGDVARASRKNCLVEIDQNKVLDEVATGGTDEVLKHRQNDVNEIDGDVANASSKSYLVEVDQIKVLDEVPTGGTDAAAGESKHSEAPVGSTGVINEIASAATASTDQFIEDKLDKEHKVIDSSQDNYVVDGVSRVQDVSIPGSSIGQDGEDMKISSSEGVLEDNLRRQENDVEVTPVASKESFENNCIKLDTEGLKLSGMEAEPHMSNPATQVYEVNPNLGSQVKSDSFSTDTLPINENKDLNDNADNVKLETEVVRQEAELQSSSKDLSDVGSSHPLDDQKPHEMQGLVGETDDDKSSNVKFSMKNDNADEVSVDVSKVEHGLESKTSNNSEQTNIHFEKARTLGDVVEPSLSPEKIEASAEDKHGLAASGDDRKDFSKIIDVVDGENMEKINLDQSDDSMEEDVVETKHVDFDHLSKKENDNTEEPIIGMTEEPGVQPSGSSDVMQQAIPSEKVESLQETKDKSHELSEKRKFQDEAGGGSKEPAKRQRRWNTETLKTAEPLNSNIALSKKIVQATPVKPILGRTNSTGGGDAPKERIVPKSSKTATNSLKIENFLRPFTLKAVQELLGRTGEVCSFWMDQIKTHCYVMYSSVEEAIETRNAVYNLQWPPNGGRLLVADFVDPQQVQTKVEGREPASPPNNTSPAVPPASSSFQAPPAQQQGRKQQAESEHPLARQPPPPPSAPPTKEMLPSPVADKNDPPIVTLDDLFRKTKVTPRIYYLPLTDEEVARRLSIRGNAKH
ncbi:hypothetical protein K7X08_023741 [Anisodus acutangulus]|uniref:SAP domain-containing protein n=1 Tax=Anisodus acutangulus TaxID=402998 RepID=A0A9Q1QVT1_9SOLA|nr:hypothetical protein K7X08_023741 [Anisodus acutangulus]